SQTAADGERLTVGDGRFVYLAGTPAQDYAEANPRDLNAQESLPLPTPPPASFTEPLEWLLEGPRPVTVEARSTTALVPQRQDGRILLHLINYNTYPDGQKLTPDENVRIRVTLPEGAQVRGVKAVSPDWEGYERDIEHASSDGTVSLTLDRLDAYAVIALEVED